MEKRRAFTLIDNQMNYRLKKRCKEADSDGSAWVLPCVRRSAGQIGRKFIIYRRFFHDDGAKIIKCQRALNALLTPSNDL